VNELASKKTVLVSILLLAVLAVYRSQRAGGSEQGSLYKRLWGIGVIGVTLSIAADFVPTVAGPFALLVLLGSLTSGGDKALQNVLASVSSKIPTPSGAGVKAPAGRTIPGSIATPPTFSATSVLTGGQ